MGLNPPDFEGQKRCGQAAESPAVI